MRRGIALAAVLSAGLAAAAVVAGPAGAKLTPLEQRWASPLVKVWNEQNAGLRLVVGAATARNALLVGSPSNGKLTRILAVLVACRKPLAKAGAPPSPRLKSFQTALSTACAADRSGATSFAKAVGAVHKGKGKQARILLEQGVAHFRRGSAALRKASRALRAVGGKIAYKA